MAVQPRDRVAILQGGKVSVGAQVDAVTAGTVDRYVAAWTSTRDELVRAAAEAERLAQLKRGKPSAADYRTARLQASLDALTRQLQQLGKRTGVQVTDVAAPVMDVPQQVLRSLEVAGAPSLNRAPAGELAAVIRRQQEAIASRYLVLSTEAEASLRDALLRGIARGEGSDAVARGMVKQAQAATAARLGINSAAELKGAAAGIVAEVRGAFAGGMQRALVLARTELIDASRVATTASYLASPDVIAGWEWMATLDKRTCPACWGMHGQVFAPDVHQEGHQQCRCTQSPLLVGETPGGNGLQDSDAAFRKLPRDAQRQVLGPKRLALYDQGVPLQAMAQRRDNRGWRAGHYVTPLDDLPTPGSAAAKAGRPGGGPPDLRGMSDDDLGDLMLRDDVMADPVKLQRVTDELDRRDAADAAPRSAADILASRPRDEAEEKVVGDYFRNLQAADDAARAVATDALPAPRAKASKEQQLREEYEALVEALQVSAIEATKGALFSRAGKRDGIYERSLFEGSAEDSVRYASEELRDYWRANPGSRVTYTEFRAPQSKRARTIRATLHDALEGDRDPLTGRRTRRARAR